MGLYAKGDKTSCQHAKDILREQLGPLGSKYRKIGLEYYESGDLGKWQKWSGKATKIMYLIHDIKQHGL